MEVMLEEEVVRERARRVIPADGTERETPINIPLMPQGLTALWEHLDALMQPQKKC